MLSPILALTLVAGVATAHGTANMTAEFMALAEPLSAAGYTTLVSVMASVANTSSGMALAQRIFDGGNYTLFAPDNDASKPSSLNIEVRADAHTVTRLPMNITSNPEMLANILSYHIVSGNFSQSNGSLQASMFPNDTIARTTLNTTDLVMLEGNKSQVLVWTSENGTVMIQNQVYVHSRIPFSFSAHNLAVAARLPYRTAA